MTTPDVIPLAFDADGRLTPDSKAAAIDALFSGTHGDRAKRALADLVRALVDVQQSDRGESTEAA